MADFGVDLHFVPLLALTRAAWTFPKLKARFLSGVCQTESAKLENSIPAE
jgi:hypothetical protein